MTKKDKGTVGLDVTLTKSEAWIERHAKQLGIILVAVVVVIGGIYLYKHIKSGQEVEAANAISKSQTAFMQGQFNLALNGDSVQEKGFLKIIKEYGGTETGNVAKLYAGLCYVNLGQTDEAIKMLEDFDTQDDQMVSPLASVALANCYADKGDKEKSAELLVKTAKKADNDAVSPVCLIQAGELFESLGNNERALELYNSIKNDYATSVLAQDIDKYIERATK